MSNNTIKFSLRKTSIGLLSLAAIAVAGTATVSAAEVEVANVTAHGTGVTADPIPTFDLNTGELTAKGSSVLNSDYKPALDPSTVDIHVHGEGTTTEVPEVKLAFENGEPYVYATGTGVTASAELPALDPSTVDIQVNGEGVTAPALEEAKVALDENGLYLTNVPTEAPAAVTPAPAAVTSAAVASEPVAKTTSTTAATLPNTGQTNSLVYLLPALGLLGAAAVVAKKKEI
ncbi:TPA: LPXTG cell wall anchor domain-containing protein [Streptococcus suis]